MSDAALLATADPATLDDLLRLAAAADARVTVARTSQAARIGWTRARLVLIGADLATDLAREGPPPRRPGVLLLARAADHDVYRLAMELGAEDVAVPAEAEHRLVEALATATEPVAERALTIAVTGGRGGAGASVLAAALGVTAMTEGIRTLLIDGDPVGGGLDLVLGQERLPGIRWTDLIGRRGRLSGIALGEALPQIADGRLRVLSWGRGRSGPIPRPVMSSVLAAAQRGFELVIADLPRSADPAEAAQAVLVAADATLLVVPTELRAVVAARRLTEVLLSHTDDVRLVVRRTAPDELRAESVAEALDLPLAGVMSSDRRIPAVLDRGDLLRLGRRGRLPGLCARLIEELWPGRAPLGEAVG